MDTFRRRVLLITGGWIAGLLVVTVRLFYWQIGLGDKLAAAAADQHWRSLTVPAERGEILASDGSPLASSRLGYDLFAVLPEMVAEPEVVASRLAPVIEEVMPMVASDSGFVVSQSSAVLAEEKRERLEKVELSLKDRLEKQDAVWVSLAKGLGEEQREKVEGMGFGGLGFERRFLRGYPEGSMAAHLLGFVGADASGGDRGYFGLEGFYDRRLAGRPGQVTQEKDAFGRPILVGDYWEVEQVGGATLVTNIDRSVQYLAEKKLRLGLEKYEAVAGTVTIMDPNTGAVLAMAAYPNYYPGRFREFTQESYPNPVVAESFEPGSVLKVAVMAWAWDRGVVDEKTICLCEGPVRIGKYIIRTWNDEYFPNSSVSDIIVHSDNVGMVFVADKLGTERLVKGLMRFGLGEVTGIDLEEEVASPLRPVEDWGEIDRATASFGQGIAVTPIQIVRAVAAIANGGELVTPRVVREARVGEEVVEVERGSEERVISRSAATAVKEMMIRAVEEGGAKWARPRGYRIAGKTGTAQIPVAGHYDEEKTIASFVGFAPADDPRFVMLVTLREPEVSPWGSETAAPLWFEIARELFLYWRIGPEK